MCSLHTRARRSQASAYTRSALEGGHSCGDRSFVRERLEPWGRIVLEAFVPSTSPDLPSRGVESRHTSDATVLNVTIQEQSSSLVRGQSVEITQAGVTLRPWRILFRTPTELDDCATRHRLTLVDRWEDWRQTPFTDSSDHHVSVYAPIQG